MILGYPGEPSVFPGETLTLHVSTDAPAFRINISRQEAELVPVYATDWIAGTYGAIPTSSNRPLHWRAFEISIPADWPSGAYLAMLTEVDGHGQVNPHPTPPPSPLAGSEYADPPDDFGALFIVRARWPSSSILY